MVDFDSGACAAHGVTPAWLAERRTLGQWSIVDPLEVSLDTFWDRINDQGETFWIGLQPQPWLKELLHLVDTITDDWHVVTAPSHCDTSYTGKVKWLKRYFGKSFDRFIITPHKHLLAKVDTLLIDDRQENCINFYEAGGRVQLFPSIGNCLYEYKDLPVEYLTKILEKHYAPQVS